jgi:single-strand DNA-binding protein
MSFNKTILMGNLTRDPEAKSFPSGTTLTTFGLAVNETWTDKTSGEKREDVCFIDVDAWGRQGEVIMEYFSKGKPILVEGRIRYRTWEADDGSKRSKHSINLERFSFVGSKNDSNGSSADDDGLDNVPF